MWAEVSTVGELRKFLEDYADDMPVWLGGTTVEGGLHYFSSVEKDSIEIAEETQTYGLMLPPERQTKETGLVIY